MELRGEEKTCTTCKAGRISFLGHPLARPGAFPRNDIQVKTQCHFERAVWGMCEGARRKLKPHARPGV